MPKTLREGQRLPENLQTWLHDRGATRSSRIARTAGSATAAAPSERESHPVEDSRAVRWRRMRSFDEACITVLSNRVSQDPAPLARNATSLGQLGDSVEEMANRLDSGVIEDSLGDIQKVIVVVLLVFTAWSLVPALGALVAGMWLRRELERSAEAPLQAP